MRHRLSSLVVWILLLAACAAPQPRPADDNRVDPDFKRPAAGALILLLPEPQVQGLQAGEAWMVEQLHKQLVAAGYRVAKLERSNYAEIWPQEVAAVGGIFDKTTGAARPQQFGQAMSSLARRVCAEAKCALVIQPRILQRTAKLEGHSAEWDGQRLPVPLKDRRAQEPQFSGTAPGLSVELLAITAAGKFGFRMYGGATLPFMVNLNESKNEPRKNLFADDRDMTDAVRIALAPLRSGKAD